MLILKLLMGALFMGALGGVTGAFKGDKKPGQRLVELVLSLGFALAIAAVYSWISKVGT